MPRKPVIGLIGGIGAGKSTAAALLAARGGRVINADALGHEALEQPGVKARLLEMWGTRVFKPDGRADRRAIAGIVFADPAELRALEGLVFPYIGRRAVEEIETARADPAVRFVVLDAAVLLEAGWNNAADRIVYIDAPRAARLERVASRGWADAELARREAAQWPAGEKMKRADAVVVNDAGPEQLAERLDRLLAEWGIEKK